MHRGTKCCFAQAQLLEEPGPTFFTDVACPDTAPTQLPSRLGRAEDGTSSPAPQVTLWLALFVFFLL